MFTDLGTPVITAETRSDGLHDIVLRVVLDGGYVDAGEAEEEAAAWRIALHELVKMSV